MKVGCVILANTVNLELYGSTQRTINTLQWSIKNYDYRINVVESNNNYLDQGFMYFNTETEVIIPNESFGYNKFLNYGINQLDTDCEWIIIANNDLVFTENWFTKLMEFNKQTNHKFKSLSPWEPNWHLKRGMDPTKKYHVGYRPAYEITGWCLVINREVIEKCNLFDPDFKYWYQDNDYALTLQKYGYQHALVTKSRVYHMVSASLDTISSKNKHHMTDGQIEVLKKKWGPNV